MNLSNKPFVHFLPGLIALAFASQVGADQNTQLKPTLSSAAGKPITTDDFSKAEHSKKWKSTRGKWAADQGSLKGLEIASEKHAAVGTYAMQHTDSAVRLSFQLAGSKGFHLSFNHPKGHLFRVMVTEKDALVRTEKDNKDPASKSVVIDKKPAKFEQGKWYTVLCETKGDKVAVQFDNGIKLEGSHESLTKKKTGYRLIVKGEGVLFDDFSIISSDQQ